MLSIQNHIDIICTEALEMNERSGDKKPSSSSTGHWWCSTCQRVLAWHEVTFEEICVTCGSAPRWVEHNHDRIEALEHNVASLLIDISLKDKALQRMTELYKSACHVSEQRRQTITAQAQRIERLEAECARLHERLEDNHVYDKDFKRVEVEPGTIPDGIECRDDTIQRLDQNIDEQHEVIERMRNALKVYAEKNNWAIEYIESQNESMAVWCGCTDDTFTKYDKEPCLIAASALDKEAGVGNFTIQDAELVLEDWNDACHKPEIFQWLVSEVKRCYELLFGGRCVACGEVIGRDKQNQQISDDELMQHILSCPKHPLAAMKKERDALKASLQTVQDERAKSFAAIDEAVGGTGLTEYQPEIDIAIVMKIKALKSALDVFTDNLKEIKGAIQCAIEQCDLIVESEERPDTPDEVQSDEWHYEKERSAEFLALYQKLEAIK